MTEKPTYEELEHRVKELEMKASERDQTEAKFLESEQRFRILFKNMPIPTYTWRLAGQDLVLTDFNDAAESITHQGIADFVGSTALEMYKDFPEVLADFRRCLSGETVIERQMPYQLRTTGEKKFLNVKYAFVPPDSVLVHTEDITARVEAERKLKESFDLLEKRVKERTAELAEAVESLKQEISHREQAEKALRESEERYRLVIERTSDLVSITTFTSAPSYIYVSPSHSAILGYRSEDLLGKCPFDFIHPDDVERLIPLLGSYLNAKPEEPFITNEQGPTERIVYRLKDGWGNWRYLETTGDMLAEDFILFVSRDVTKRVKTEEELKNARDELEQKVKARTQELEIKTKGLEEANAALRVLLGVRDKERIELQDKMLFNVKQLAEPYLEKLKLSGLSEKQKVYLDILESSLNEIISPVSRDLALRHGNFTPSEIHIANLIKYGKSTKEIADILSLSMRTIETHRRNIRRKLGIKNTKMNLRSYFLNSSGSV